MSELYIGRGKDEDNASLIRFLDEVFFWDSTCGTNFLGLLPKIYKDRYRPAYNNFVVQEPGGAYRAAVGNFDCDLIVGGAEIKACCIGNVAVGKEYRSMGYMIRLMEESIADMKARGVDLSYLGGQRQRYAYFGYEYAGTSYEFGFSRASYRHALGNIPSGLKMEKLDAGDTESVRAIDAIYTKSPIHALRKADEYYDVLRSWEDVPYVIKENGSFVGYAVQDPNSGNVCEFGFTDDALLPRFVAAVFENTEKDSIDFSIAPYEIEKLAFFSPNASGMRIEHNEHILILNFRKVLAAYLTAKTTYEKLCDGEITVLIHGKTGDESLRVRVSDNIPEVTPFDGEARYEFDALEAVRVFFSNFPSDRSVLPPEVRQWLPLPMYFSSRDTM